MPHSAVVVPGTPPPIPDLFVCRFVSLDGRSLYRVVRDHLDWGSGPHPKARFHDDPVRRAVASVGLLRHLEDREFAQQFVL